MLTFFNKYFSHHLVKPTNDPLADATRALNASHPVKNVKKGRVSRLSSGWAIVRPGRSTIQFELAATGFEYSRMTRYEAFLAELENWDGTSRMFLQFSKRSFPADNLFRTFDVRQVRICGPNGVETFDFTAEPGPDACQTHRVLWNIMQKRARQAKKEGAV